ncbi:MAG: hypothetical protein IPM45_16765 [Acidimicrobiales bacterium]|nr:hypothetical protein [Acidimicrobiales bacterium]
MTTPGTDEPGDRPGAAVAQWVAMEVIAAARGVLDAAEQLVRDPEQAARLAAVLPDLVRSGMQVIAGMAAPPASPAAAGAQPSAQPADGTGEVDGPPDAPPGGAGAPSAAG